MAVRPRGAGWEVAKAVLVDRGDAFAGAQHDCHLAEIAGQRARPAERVDPVGEACADQFAEAMHAFGAGAVRGEDGHGHA